MTIMLKDIITSFEAPITGYIILAVCIDVILGLAKAILAHNLNSTISIKGLFKQAFIVVLPPLLHPILISMTGGSIFYSGFTFLLLVSVLLSIVENYAALGLPYPELLVRFIDNNKIDMHNVPKQDTQDKHEDKDTHDEHEDDKQL